MANRNEKAQFLTVQMVMKQLNMCRASTIRLATEAEALLRYGNVQRIDWQKISNYFKERKVNEKGRYAGME